MKTLTVTLVDGSGSNSNMRRLMGSLNSYDMNCKIKNQCKNNGNTKDNKCKIM